MVPCQSSPFTQETPVTNRFDRAQDRAGPGVDLVDLAGAILADPERPLGPGQAGVAAVGRGRNGGDDLARARIDLLDPVAGELPEVPAVEGGAGVGGDGELAHQPAANGIEGNDGHAMDVVDAGIGAVLSKDLRLPGLGLVCPCHDSRLPNWQRAWE